MNLTMTRQIRGSVLLVFGRGISLGLNLVTQVLCVRYLSKADYGSFAYAIAMIEMLALLNTLGFDNSIPRFAAIYDQNKKSRLFVGLLVISFSLVVLFGLFVVGLGFYSVDLWSEWTNANPLAVNLIVLLLVLVPIQAIDALMLGLFGVFSGARHILLRKHIVRPILRLAAVLFMIYSEGDTTTLAVSFVVVGVLGVAVFLGALVRVVSSSELMQTWDRKIEYRLQETLYYNAPILTSNLVFIFRGALIIFLLEYFHNASEVADLLAVMPFGRLVELVLLNFTVLFVPAISRAFAADDKREISATYIGTQIWITLLSFPLFALGFGYADILTPFLFGESYASASEVLAWLALGFYIRIVFGLASRTLKVLGHLRVVITIDVITVFFALIVSLWLIPLHGATGAAISASLTMAFHGLFSQFALYRVSQIGLWDQASGKLYASVAVTVLALCALRWLVDVNAWVLGIAAMLPAGLLPFLFRYQLSIHQHTPELKSALKSLRSRFKG
jgi:O-antigen/teichoic acid export membrane protein